VRVFTHLSTIAPYKKLIVLRLYGLLNLTDFRSYRPGFDHSTPCETIFSFAVLVPHDKKNIPYHRVFRNMAYFSFIGRTGIGLALYIYWGRADKPFTVMIKEYSQMRRI